MQAICCTNKFRGKFLAVLFETVVSDLWLNIERTLTPHHGATNAVTKVLWKYRVNTEAPTWPNTSTLSRRASRKPFASMCLTLDFLGKSAASAEGGKAVKGRIRVRMRRGNWATMILDENRDKF